MADGTFGFSATRDRAVRPLHIVHVLTRLLRSGSEENTIATCRWQAANGHRVTLIHGAEHDPVWAEELAGTVRLVAMPEVIHPVRPLADWRAVNALGGAFRALGPDVIHTHQSKAGIVGRMAAQVVPDTLVVHGIHILPWEGVGTAQRAAYLAAERMAARHTDLFIAVSDGIARATCDTGICRPDQVHVVHSGMDLARFQQVRARRDPQDGPVILMLAAFERRKRHAAFLQVLPRIVARVPGVRLLLAGAGPEEPALRALVAALGLQDRVVFCGHRPDPEALIAMADLTVLTSLREGLPRVVVQSVAAGCPVVVTRVPGIGDILRDGVNGCITDAQDMTQTADRVASLLNDRAVLDRLRAGALATDVSAWSLDRLGARTTRLYETALGIKAAGMPTGGDLEVA